MRRTEQLQGLRLIKFGAQYREVLALEIETREQVNQTLAG